MAAQCDPLSGYLQQPLSDPGSNSERSTDSPVPGSEEDSAGPPRPLHSPEWGEERFRVDRKKLEAMLQAAAEGKGKSGEDFFQKIMEETNTQIAWPSKLKIGAKSKKVITENAGILKGFQSMLLNCMVVVFLIYLTTLRNKDKTTGKKPTSLPKTPYVVMTTDLMLAVRIIYLNVYAFTSIIFIFCTVL